MQYFTIKEEHLKLLRSAVVSWDPCEFGAPAIDCKRPYGNSSVYNDINRILGLNFVPDEEYEEFTEEQINYMNRIHKETQTALQVVLATSKFEVGKYVADDYCRNWREEGV